MKGYRTILLGALMIMLPPLFNYLIGIKWSDYVSADTAFMINGALMIALRAVTTTPIGGAIGKNIIILAIATAATLGLMSNSARAGDINAPSVTLPAKAPVALPATATCSIAGCQGFELGGNFTGSGTGVSVANLGSLNAGGSYFGGEANYMTYNGTYLLGLGAKLEYEAANPPTAIVGGAFSNKLFAFEYAEAGGALSNIFNIAPVTLPGWLSNAVPSVRLGACQHGPMQGICSAFHARLFIPNSKWTVNADYANAQYNSGTALAPGVTGNTENRGSLGVSYHF